MKTKMGRAKIFQLFGWIILTLTAVLAVFQSSSADAKVVPTSPITTQSWIISEIYPGDNDLEGSYIELYNNDNKMALGYQDFLLNLPFDTGLSSLPAIGDFRSYKPHTYRKLSYGENWTSWLAQSYIKVMYGDDTFHEITDALDEQPTYSYQRCQYEDDDNNRVLSNQFYYGKKTPGKGIDCDDKTLVSTDPDDYVAGKCTGLKLNEIGSYLYDEDQFIEVINDGDNSVNLSNCYLAKSKDDDAVHHPMDDYDLAPGEVYATNVEDSDLEHLTKASGIIYLIDSDDETVVDYKRYTGAKDETSTALDKDGQWQLTYSLTPGEPNIIDKYPPCPDGQVRDDKTHRCRAEVTDDDDNNGNNNSSTSDDNNNDTDSEPKPCKEGYERNPLTNRCRKVVDEDEETNDGLKPCKEGYERNPETNRCRKIASSDEEELTPCKEGYERNPATNRCVKKQTSTSTLTQCKEGYERNPATNRCIKKKTSEDGLTPCKEGYERNPETHRCVKKKSTDTNKDGDGQDGDAKYPVTTDSNQAADTSTITLIIVIAVIIAASIGIVIWQYHTDIAQWWQRLTNQRKAQKAADASKVPLATEPDQQSPSDWMDKLSNDDQKQP